MHKKLGIFSRYHSTQDEHKAFVGGILQEQRLTRRIAQLQHLRSMGIRTLAQ